MLFAASKRWEGAEGDGAEGGKGSARARASQAGGVECWKGMNWRSGGEDKRSRSDIGGRGGRRKGWDSREEGERGRREIEGNDRKATWRVREDGGLG